MVAFSFFGISVHWYGIFYTIAFIVGYLFFLSIKKNTFLESYAPGFYRLLQKSPEDIILYIILGLLVGGRLGHVFIYDFSYYLHNPFHVFAFWEGGMSFIGGILGVIVALFFLSRKYKFRVRDFWVLTDFVIFPTSFGIMLGRIGNFLNQELYGRLVSDVFPTISSSVISFCSRLSLFHIYDRVDGLLRINTNFLASFFEGFLLLLVSLLVLRSFLKKKKRIPGFLSSLFLVWYSLVRFFLEYLRMDSQSEYISFFTKSQWFFVGFFLIGIVLLYRSLRSSRYMK